MNRYSLLNEFLTGVSLSLSLTIAIWLKDYLSIYKFPVLVTFLVAIVVIAMGLTWLKTFLGYLLTSVPRIRKLFLGSQYVEGTWIDIVRMPDGTDFFGLVNITPEGNSLRFSVENTDRDGKHLGSFSAIQIRFDWPRIVFLAEGITPTPKYSEGIVAVLFEETSTSSRHRFTAKCLDFKQPLPDSIEGWKLDAMQVQQLNDPKQRTTTLRQIVASTFPIPDKMKDKY